MTRLWQSLRNFRQAHGYEMQLRTVPDHSNIDIAASLTFEGRVTVPAGSYLYAIAATHSQAAGFDLQIRDTGTGQELFSKRIFSENVKGAQGTGRSPQYWLPKPLLLLEPGLALVQIWNRAAAVNTIQVVLFFACPKETEK